MDVPNLPDDALVPWGWAKEQLLPEPPRPDPQLVDPEDATLEILVDLCTRNIREPGKVALMDVYRMAQGVESRDRLREAGQRLRQVAPQ